MDIVPEADSNDETSNKHTITSGKESANEQTKAKLESLAAKNRDSLSGNAFIIFLFKFSNKKQN